ncbi:MAG TPA: hypothetical protein VNX65_01390 [Patescibacteria group bacterium]|nr:hypothetical protein [Patescibacteria group bacterium]
MSKPKKKRDKRYRDKDDTLTSGSSQPTIHHYRAVVRGPLGEWWHDHAKAVRLISTYGGGGVVVIWLIFESVRVLSGH